MRRSICRILLIICSLFLSQQIYSYDVTSGQSGAWFDPTHDGEGYFLQVINESQAVVFWFSYDKSGDQLWMIGVGNIEGSKIIFPEMLSPHGGKFGPDFDPEDVEYPTWGSLEFDFSTCNAATANYSGPSEFGSGTLSLTRISTLWGLDCQGNDSNPPSTGIGFLNGGFSGSWFDYAHDGEGFVVEVLDETTAVVIWFTYDTEGNPAWMLGVGQIDGASIIVNEFLITSGGIFGPEFNPADVVYETWGPAAYTFGSCGLNSTAGNMRYIPPPEFGIESSQFLNRITTIDGLQCDFLTDTYDVMGTMQVAENIFLDGDVNDPNVPEVSNDLDAITAQQLVPPAKVAGFATAVPTENEGDRFVNEIDEWDAYVLAIRNGESISLNVSDWDSNDKGAVDLDLYLVNINDPQTTVDSSLGTNQTEWVTAPEDGNYFVLVNAYSGTSNYLLKSGQSAPIAVAKLSASVEMATGEIVASLKPQNSYLASIGKKNSDQSQVARLEKDNALTRVKKSGGSEVLYSVSHSRVDHLVPHPLTLTGRGSITPEDWQVIRAAKALSASEDYNWAGPNYIQHQMAIPNDPGYDAQWHYPLIKLPQAWDITKGSSNVVVAVIDSGVYDHPDLVSNVDYSLGRDFVSSTLSSGDGDGIDSDARDPGKSYPSYTDYMSHGTHVAGTVGAKGNNGVGVSGVNWDVTIMPVRVLGIEGSGSCWDIQQGMRWSGQLSNSFGTLPARKADIINLSLGGPYCSGYQELVDALVAKGVVIIAASGNENSAIPNYPASLNNVISVSATTSVDERAPYSSYGSGVDVAAPGGDTSADLNDDGYPDGVLSPIMVVDKGTSTRTNGYGFLQGTSMASPHIAGIAALMKSTYPEMGPNEFFTAISSGKITVDLAQNGPTNKDIYFGYGRIDVQKAVNWAVEQSQGQPSDAFLTTSISAANFGSNQLAIDFDVAKAGSGDISVTSGGSTEDWIQLWTVNTDNQGLGTYSITVDRAGLIDGSYSGWAGIEGSDGSITWISVAMQVGEKVAGEAGYLYALLLDSWTFGNVKQWDGLAISSEYSIDLSSNPPGTYFLMVGSDIDHDFTVCDPGEFCQIYPLNSQASEIIVSNRDIHLGYFIMGFPNDIDGGNGLSAAFEPESESNENYILNIKTRIGTSGVSRKR